MKSQMDTLNVHVGLQLIHQLNVSTHTNNRLYKQLCKTNFYTHFAIDVHVSGPVRTHEDGALSAEKKTKKITIVKPAKQKDPRTPMDECHLPACSRNDARIHCHY